MIPCQRKPPNVVGLKIVSTEQTPSFHRLTPHPTLENADSPKVGMLGKNGGCSR